MEYGKFLPLLGTELQILDNPVRYEAAMPSE
jgi:hypothetical protein